MPIDHKPFLSDNFDVNAYANSVLSGRVYDPEASSSSEPNVGGKSTKGREVEKGDVGVELARLSYGIVSLGYSVKLIAYMQEDVTKQLRSEVS